MGRGWRRLCAQEVGVGRGRAGAENEGGKVAEIADFGGWGPVHSSGLGEAILMEQSVRVIGRCAEYVETNPKSQDHLVVKLKKWGMGYRGVKNDFF